MTYIASGTRFARRIRNHYGYALGMALAAVMTAPAAAQATETVQTYVQQPQSLNAALKQFASKAGLQIMFSDREVRGKTAPALNGRFTVEQALDRLLSGSGLAHRTIGGKVVVVQPAARPVRVSARGNGPVVAFAAAAAVEAEASAAPPPAEQTGPELVVTGSRIVRDGSEAPTPVSVLTADQIQSAAPVTIADYVNQLPALAASVNPRSHGNTTSGGQAGLNLLNLRGLGPNRTLTLLNGRRVTPSTLTGAVDINTIPTALVRRVDVVTGGASAAWGSDAVSGVVNFVLDTGFTGIKGNFQGGISGMGDAANFSGSLSAGTKFADDRGHILISANYSKAENAYWNKRDWYKGYKVIANPAFRAGNGEPARLILPNTSLATTDYGLVTTGPLAGTAFDVNGQVETTSYPFGPIRSGLYQSGGPRSGDYFGGAGIVAPVEQGAVYGRASFEFSDAVSIFAEGSYGDSTTSVLCCSLRRQAADTIRIDNVFLPGSVRTRMQDAKLSTISVMSNKGHIGIMEGVNDRAVLRLTGGLEGKIGQWRWNTSAQYGRAKIRNAVENNVIVARYLAAIDSVANPLTGAPICRSTLTAPSNGCVPLNPLGGQPLTDAQRNWFIGTSVQNQVIRQDVFEASAQGPLATTGAGDITLATGIEYRGESATADADAIARTNGWFISNYAPFKGAYNVKEVFAEIAVPLVKDSALGRSLEVSGAVRHADYSVSGGVTTWKLGGIYKPVDDVTVRVTRSRDIRAPNLNDMFVTAFTNTISGIIDPQNPGMTYQVTQVTSGNLGLKPEKADSFTAGLVYQPQWLPGLSLSVDYYDIRISDAITVPSSQQIVSQCASGGTIFCNQITRDANNVISQIRVAPFNALKEAARGVDFELGYRRPLGNGTLDLRAMVTYVDKLEIISLNGRTSRAGELGNNLGASQGVPHFTGLFTTGWANEALDLQLKARLIGGGKMEVDYGPLDINLNDVPATVYLDAFVGFNVSGRKDTQFFLAVDNLADKAPPLVVSQDNANAQNSGTNMAVYDLIGRTFRAGFRFKY